MPSCSSTGVASSEHAPAVDQRTASRLPHGEQVGQDVEMRKEAELLSHDRDAVRDGVGRVPEADLIAIEAHGARVRTDSTGHDLDQRGLAGPILPEQRMHAARADGEVGAVECHDASVRLADALRLEGSHRSRVSLPISSAARCSRCTGRRCATMSSPTGASAAATVSSLSWRAMISSTFSELDEQTRQEHEALDRLLTGEGRVGQGAGGHVAAEPVLGRHHVVDACPP